MTTIKNSVLYVFNVGLAFIALANFYIFSRFTVDDAFISWRYGLNLAEFGTWSYNPTSFDLTQAYTNPLFAFTSIIPAYLGWDVVLFFKLFAIIFAAISGFLVLKNSKYSDVSVTLFIVLMCVPATMIHLFSGLETYFFAVSLGLLFIYIDQEKYKYASMFVILLFFLRPEAWILAAVFPIFYLLQARIVYKEYPRLSMESFLVLLVPIILVFYLVLNKMHFGYFLPNSFFVKSLDRFLLFEFIVFLIHLVPIALFLFLGRIRASIFMGLFFSVIVIQYAGSELIMNYANRFTYHILVPIYIFAIYVASRISGDVILESEKITHLNRKFKISYLFGSLIFLYLCFFVMNSSSKVDLVNLANYYPRALASHAELGHVLRDLSDDGEVDSFSIGDAGMTAYHSGIVNLDNIGLSSSLVAHAGGVTPKIVKEYDPDIIVFHTDTFGGVREIPRQRALQDFAHAQNMKPLCNIYMGPDYSLLVYADDDYPQILSLCRESEGRNNITNRAYFTKYNLSPPWIFWRE